MKRRLGNKILALCLALVMTSSVLDFSIVNKMIVANADTNYGVDDPDIDEESATYSCLYFGRYKQAFNDYALPIKWRVMEIDDNNIATLISNDALERKPFDERGRNVYWNQSSIRSWLNGEFYAKSFSQKEKKDIVDTYISEGGTWTYDKVFLPSIVDINIPLSYCGRSEKVRLKDIYNREVNITENALSDKEFADGEYIDYAMNASLTRTVVDEDQIGYRVDDYYILDSQSYPDTGSLLEECQMGAMWEMDDELLIRPCIRINLNSSNWSYAGTEWMGPGDSFCGTSQSSRWSAKNILDKYHSKVTTDNYTKCVDMREGEYNSFVLPNTSRFTVDIDRSMTGDCNDLTPQGITHTEDYILISAYCSGGMDSQKNKHCQDYVHNKYSSVIYVLDKKTKRHLTTLSLKGISRGNHVGGLTYVPGNGSRSKILIAGSDANAVYYITNEDIEDVIYGNRMSVSPVVDAKKLKELNLDYTVSFIEYYGGYIYVGHFEAEKENYIKCYNANDLKEKPIYIKLPKQTQGVTFATEKSKTYMVCSVSNGRKILSSIYLCDLEKVMDAANGRTLLGFLGVWKKSNSMLAPYMSEEISFDNGVIYNLFESSASKYGGDIADFHSDKCPVVCDRVFGLNAKALISTVYKPSLFGKNTTSSGTGYNIIDCGSCGDGVEYAIYENGDMTLSGYGEMDDYNYKDVPWLDYKDKITTLTIGADVNYIGEASFENCKSLKNVYIDSLSDEQEDFWIGENAFANCTSLQAFTAPNKAYEIEDDAFIGVSSEFSFVSDSSDMIRYAQDNGLHIHKHDVKYVTTVAPSCSVDGYNVMRCECGYEEKTNLVSSNKAHNYELKETVKSTTNSNGYKKYICSNCQMEYVEELSLLPESTKNITATTDKTSTTNKKSKKKIKVGRVKIKYVKVKGKKITVKWKKVSGASGYSVKVASNKKFKKASKYSTKSTKGVLRLKNKKIVRYM